MLERLKVDNFKAWQRLDIRLGRVTGLFGTNSAGKSSILQFLLMLKQTRNATDRGLVLDPGGPNDLVNLGTFRDIVHGRDENRKIEWQLDWTLREQLKIGNPAGTRRDILFAGSRMQHRCSVGLRLSSPWAHFLKYRFGETVFALEPKADEPTKFRLTPDGGGDGFRFIRTPGRPWPLPGPVKTHLFPSQARTFFQNADFLGEFEVEYERLMDRIHYLGPLREYPQREYRWTGVNPNDVGPRGERAIDAILAATARKEKRNLGPRRHYMSFQGMMAHWLRELGLIHSFELAEIGEGTNLWQARVKRDSGGPETMLTDVGFGVSQALPVLVLLYYVPEGSVVLMEQPELHLHPSVQSGLADLILNVARTRHVQVIVESHSEHLLRRFQRRVAEDTASFEDVKLYFISATGGRARLEDLDLDEWGEIRNWPDHFFGDELGELCAIQTASLERRLAQRQ